MEAITELRKNLESFSELSKKVTETIKNMVNGYHNLYLEHIKREYERLDFTEDSPEYLQAIKENRIPSIEFKTYSAAIPVNVFLINNIGLYYIHKECRCILNAISIINDELHVHHFNENTGATETVNTKHLEFGLIYDIANYISFISE